MLPEGMIQTTAQEDAHRFRAEEYGSPEFFIDGILVQGTVSFTVVAEVRGRRGTFTGRQFFTAMLDHFGVRRVKVIAACWSDARPERTTNLDLFNRETHRGATPEDAAFATHTGRWAGEKGFTVLASIDTTPDDFPGGYEQVLAEFKKPPPNPRKRRSQR